jgi:hypothetical protein
MRSWYQNRITGSEQVRNILSACGASKGPWVEWVNTKAQLADAPSRIQEWRTYGGLGHEHETAFSNLITDTRPLILPTEHEWPVQLAFCGSSGRGLPPVLVARGDGPSSTARRH